MMNNYIARICLLLIICFLFSGCFGRNAGHWLEKAAEHEKTESYDKAIAAYTKALELDSENADIYFSRGMARTMRRDWNNGIEDFTKALGIQPKNALFYSARSLAMLEKKDFKNALTDAEKARDLEPSIYDSFLEQMKDEIKRRK